MCRIRISLIICWLSIEKHVIPPLINDFCILTFGDKDSEIKAIVTNRDLFKWNVKDSNVCSFCSEYEESIYHLFYECDYVQILWRAIQKFVYDRGRLEFCVNFESIILNTQPGPAANLPNGLCLITKQFIYTKRCMNQPLTEIELCHTSEVWKIQKSI